MSSQQLSVIDLFAGCGGLSRGFMDAGFNIILGVDNDETALKTFQRNHGNTATLNADLSSAETYVMMDEFLTGFKVDIITAGPPCQGFSLTGPRKFDDPRNSLYLAVFEAVNRYKPKVFIVENVPGMASLYKSEIKKEVVRRFENLGYVVRADVLCAADYGVPQIRKRLFFLGVRKDVGLPVFHTPVNQPHQYITCRQAIGDLPARVPSNDSNWFGLEEDSYKALPTTEYQRKMRGDCNTLYNHVATKHKKFVIDTIAQVPEGCNYKSLPKGVGESRKFNEAWTRYHGDKPSKTIDTGHRNHFHYEYNRVPTIRENARLQSFPDDFVFLGTRTQQNRQVGNAVLLLLGYYIGLKVRELFT